MTHFDSPQIDVEPRPDGRWRWTVGYERDGGGIVDFYAFGGPGRRVGTALTRRGALHAARRQLRRERRFRRKQARAISITGDDDGRSGAAREAMSDEDAFRLFILAQQAASGTRYTPAQWLPAIRKAWALGLDDEQLRRAAFSCQEPDLMIGATTRTTSTTRPLSAR